MRKGTFFVCLAACLMILAASSVAWSQSVQGVITGTVTDPTGAVVPNATVTITNAGTNASQTTTTGSDGSYRFSLVPPGTYSLEIKAANFGGVRVSGIVLEASQTMAINRQLELAKTSQLVEVTAEIPLVQTATSDLGFQVDSSTIQHAALVDRDIFGVLPFMAPSVSPGLDMSPTSGGAREAGTSYMLNGAEDNNNFRCLSFPPDRNISRTSLAALLVVLSRKTRLSFSLPTTGSNCFKGSPLLTLSNPPVQHWRLCRPTAGRSPSKS